MLLFIIKIIVNKFIYGKKVNIIYFLKDHSYVLSSEAKRKDYKRKHYIAILKNSNNIFKRYKDTLYKQIKIN